MHKFAKTVDTNPRGYRRVEGHGEHGAYNGDLGQSPQQSPRAEPWSGGLLRAQ